MILYSKDDNILSQLTQRMADTLGSFMAAVTNSITAKFITSASAGSNWQKFINPFALELDESAELCVDAVKFPLFAMNKLSHVYTLSIPADIDDITDVASVTVSGDTTMMKSSYIWDFIYGYPLVVSHTVTAVTDTVLVGNRIAYDLNGGYMLNYVTVNGIERDDYIVTYSAGYQAIKFTSNLNINDVVVISYRTDNTFYYDKDNYTLYIRGHIDDTVDTFYQSDTGQWYPDTPVIGHDGYKPVSHHIWNRLDSYALLSNTERKSDENDSEFKERIIDAYLYRPSQNITGIRNVLAQKLGLIQHTTWPTDTIDITLDNIWPDSVRIDYKPLRMYSFEFDGVVVPSNVNNNSVRVFRNGLLLRADEDYTFDGYTVSFTRPLKPLENVVIDYLLQDDTYPTYVLYKVPNTQIDGVNRLFNLPHQQVIGKTQVYHNLLRKVNNADYIEHDGSIEFISTPTNTDNIFLVYYIRDNHINNGYRFERYIPTEPIDGVNTTFTIPEAANTVMVYVNGGYKHINDDYTMPNSSTVVLHLAPEVGSTVEIDYYVHNDKTQGGCGYEQLSFMLRPDGSIEWHIGTLMPSEHYAELSVSLKYLHEDESTFDDVYMTASVRTSSLYATGPIWFNTRSYIKQDVSMLGGETIAKRITLEPTNNGYVSAETREPNELYGYVPYHPVIDTRYEYYNTRDLDDKYIRYNDNIVYVFKVRNTGNIRAEDVICNIYVPQRFELIDNGGGSFSLHCHSPAGKRHDVRYIRTSRWSADTAESINIYHLWDEYYQTRLLMQDGTPTNQLIEFVNTLNDITLHLWSNGKWDVSLWETMRRIYGDVISFVTYNTYTSKHELEAADSRNNSYSYLPHYWDPDIRCYQTTERQELGNIPRRMDFVSGIGFDNDLELSVDDELEYFNDTAINSYKIKLKPGVFYLNDIEGYQYAAIGLVSFDTTNPLGASNDIAIPADSTEIRCIVVDANELYACRYTEFYDSSNNRTHTKYEVLRGNNYNTKLHLEFRDVTVNALYHEGALVSNSMYTVDDNTIVLNNNAPGVEYVAQDNEYVIYDYTSYEVEYTLNHSFYISNDAVYFDAYYQEGVIYYERSADSLFNTGLSMHPANNPYTRKFVYADIYEPSAEMIECWCTPTQIRNNSNMPVVCVCAVTDKHGTPVSGCSVQWLSTDGQSYTVTTDQYGRGTWFFMPNSHAGNYVHITAKISNDLLDSCKVYIY